MRYLKVLNIYIMAGYEVLRDIMAGYEVLKRYNGWISDT